MTEAGTGVTCVQAKGLLATPRAKRTVWKGFFPRAFRESMALLTPWLGTSSLQNRDRIHFSYVSHPVCGTLL